VTVVNWRKGSAGAVWLNIPRQDSSYRQSTMPHEGHGFRKKGKQQDRTKGGGAPENPVNVFFSIQSNIF
jgi:hypothetical protein